MNLMDFLGFAKKGAEIKPDARNAMNHNFRFKDKYPREVDEFLRFADCHPEMKFLVTRIGCGIAGWSAEEIAPLFARGYNLPNIYLPKDFWKVLTYKYRG
ncbi:MAG: hypothetical protein II537_02725 [Bacteroidales bacterium]|nr:hypothetical protein [Bacteroidales bacterium]